MLIDEVNIILKGGHGGAGKVSFYPGEKSGPSGGNGGKGGDLYIEATTDLTVLNQFSRKRLVSAENGMPGGLSRKIGKDGRDIVVFMPVGTVLIEKNTGEVITIDKGGQKILVCKGGLGGWGNYEFKSSRNTTPEYAQSGLDGEEKHFQASLKLLADFGLIGLPNAGKSSLLNELTSTSVKTADYPFTTLEPNLGVLNRKIIADIPGLIEGASDGRGLGVKFLKHIEKTSVLLHCIAADSPNLEEDYKVVVNELESFSNELIKKPQIILLTKSDLVDKKQLNERIKRLKKFKHKIYPVSIHDWDSLEELKKALTTS
ncbi:MAG: hypothetical protein ACD_30C00052G0013 [uncultured bacterium]|uniref:GTPase Obg n=4 Tax=Candidatus Daviesiibacteriota TaxID=1752718 RepID=A0A0G0HZE0_9BACT|nr:MAG: hypothetical protein ACD_30C00052G0013 [uncultured bacterium]KKQ09196.1 MAG: GTPase obg [Candidatus Daviesbacteria bacterium GW2011_GWB1_36_5]KKQ14794.1 MAG: GTPase obg [Candidatus Daviesbacteria bacterium GW2011_GWA1_36_8]OGE16430.1 MAG: hypothetical protein A2858_01685 [Candidatus Daviesbacteria bacterium RIFCSPHIGHO2_01_FULL_36_37]OGE35322.1 MAG: hypothetical protein A3E66_00510 [Candidatus Daviesbacteria bacterium RIFCSPHIGHO2_12_FULL_37_16]